MRTRRTVFILLSLCASYVAVAGCSDDDAATPPTVSVDAAGNLPETSPVDSAKPDVRDARVPENTGSACTVASDCYGDLDAASLQGGEPVCIDKVTNGYCTHKCKVDADCCAVPGECRSGLKQVCSSFENADDKYCFLSCEPADIDAASDAGASDAGTSDAGASGDDYCEKNASTEFGCRSTGGGAENRKVCFPVGPGGDGGKKDAGGDADADAP
jgi:hypothetical protein